eukprot:9567804-Prorocentrum_lima.AAC.1
MTSSLVGSEMCIRDSMSAASSWQGQSSQETRMGAPPQWNPRPKFFCSNTVSYTHLTLPTICSV